MQRFPAILRPRATSSGAQGVTLWESESKFGHRRRGRTGQRRQRKFDFLASGERDGGERVVFCVYKVSQAVEYEGKHSRATSATEAAKRDQRARTAYAPAGTIRGHTARTSPSQARGQDAAVEQAASWQGMAESKRQAWERIQEPRVQRSAGQSDPVRPRAQAHNRGERSDGTIDTWTCSISCF